MEKTHTSPIGSIHQFPLRTLVMTGAVLGLAVTLFFILPVINRPHPYWPKYWMIQPFFVLPVAGASGGVWYYIMDFFRYQGSWKRVLAWLSSIIGFIVAIWMGLVLGFVGTMWH